MTSERITTRSGHRLRRRQPTWPLMGVLILAALTANPFARGEEDPPHLDDYELCWADEFDRDGAPSPANWRFENGLLRNKEAQWYQPDNARCERRAAGDRGPP